MGNSNELKNNLDQTTNMDEVRDEKKLTDDEVGEVAGGVGDSAVDFEGRAAGSKDDSGGILLNGGGDPRFC
ncbi:MAG: hypothetical protein J6X55_13540 [Victivallales bacterium]|nr:hypothetical protein [Victivallales bacterium]